MSYTSAPTIVIIDDIHATEYLGVHRYLEMLEQLKSKNFTPVVIVDYPNDIYTGGSLSEERQKLMVQILDMPRIHLNELKYFEPEPTEVKSNKPYWRTKERW